MLVLVAVVTLQLAASPLVLELDAFFVGRVLELLHLDLLVEGYIDLCVSKPKNSDTQGDTLRPRLVTLVHRRIRWIGWRVGVYPHVICGN